MVGAQREHWDSNMERRTNDGAFEWSVRTFVAQFVHDTFLPALKSGEPRRGEPRDSLMRTRPHEWSLH